MGNQRGERVCAIAGLRQMATHPLAQVLRTNEVRYHDDPPSAKIRKCTWRAQDG